MDEQRKRRQINLIELGWLLTALAIPLVINPWGSNAFELPKAALLKAFVLAMGMIALTRIGEIRVHLHRPEYRLLNISALAVSLSFVLTTFFSINPRISLWGEYTRQQGLITLASFLILFFLTIMFLRTREQADRLWLTLVWGSLPVLLYAFVQFLHFDPMDWRSDSASPLVSTLGRSNFIGTYLVLIVPLTLARLIASPLKPVYLLLGAAQIFCLALSLARGAWVGAGAAILILAILRAIAARNKRAKYALVAMIGIVILIVVLLPQIPGMSRVTSLTRTDEGSTAARLTIWQTTLPLVAARPILGYGPDTMALVFPRVFPPQLVYYQGRLASVDRAHNLWLDLGMSVGLVGIVCIGVLLYALARRLFQMQRKATDTWARWLGAGLIASVAGHLIDLEFSFEVTGTATIFCLILALGVALSQEWAVTSSIESPPQRWADRLIYLPAAAIIALMIGTISVRPVAADIASYESQKTGNTLATRIKAGERAVALWSLEPEYHLRLAWLYFEVGDGKNAEAEMQAVDQLVPDTPRTWATRGDMYARTSRFAQASDAYQQASSRAPNIAAYHAARGWALAQQSRFDEAAVELKRAVDLDATDAAAYQELGNVFMTLGRKAEANWAWQEAARWNKK